MTRASLLLLAACLLGSCRPAPKCVPGVTAVCSGTAGCRGAQACLSTGDGFSPCDCGTQSFQAGGGFVGVGGGTAGGDAGGASSAGGAAGGASAGGGATAGGSIAGGASAGGTATAGGSIAGGASAGGSAAGGSIAGGASAGGSAAGGSTAGGASAGGTGGGSTAGGLAGGSSGGTTAGGASGGAVAGGSSGTGASCSDALPLAIGVIRSGNIDVAGKRLHYRVPVSSTVTYFIATEANPNEVSGALDTTLSVFDDTGATLLSAMDDAAPRSGTDAQLFFRPRQSGFVCIRVEDFATWKGDPPSLRSPNRFTVVVHADGTGGLVAELEPNDATPGQPLPPNNAVLVGGALTTASDVDVFSFTIPSGRTLLNVELPPNGDPLGPAVSSYGSTLGRISIAVQNSSGITLAALGPAPVVASSSAGLSVPVTAGTYRVLISRGAAAPGANDFYGTIISGSDDQPAENESLTTPSNNSKTAAETLPMITSPTDPKVRNALWRGYLPSGDAVDYFRFTTTSVSNTLVLHCLAGRDGSGLSSFTVSVYGPSSTPIRSETESPNADIVWANIPMASGTTLTLPTASAYYVALSNSSTTPGNAGRFYRCRIEVVRP